MKFDKLCQQCCEANRQLPRTGLVDLTFGNVSILDPEQGVFAIKPSGVDYDALKPEDIVVLDLEGRVVEGKLRPSSDTPTHRRLYLGFAGKNICALVHTHSRCAVAFAQAARELPCLGTTHCDYFNGAVPVTRAMTADEVAEHYEWNTGAVILECFSEKSPEEVPAALIRNHGPFAWGATAQKALENALALEIVADMALRTMSINPQAAHAPAHLLNKHFSRKHGPSAYYGQK